MLPIQRPKLFDSITNPLDQVVLFAHGAWQHPAHFEILRQELKNLGVRSEAVDLPSADPGAGDADDADALEAAADTWGTEIFLVGHSRGCGAVTRLASRPRMIDSIAGIALINSGGPHTMPPAQRLSRGDPRYTSEFLAGIIDRGDGYTEYDKETGLTVFFNRTPSALAREAVALFRPQRNPQERELSTSAVPSSIPVRTARSRDCRVHNPKPARERVGVWLGEGRSNIEVSIDGDHSPHLSIPKQTAQHIMEWMAEAARERLTRSYHTGINE